MPLILLAISIAMLGVPAWLHEEQVLLATTEVRSLVHYLSLFSSALERYVVQNPNTTPRRIAGTDLVSLLPEGFRDPLQKDKIRKDKIWGYIEGSQIYTVFENPLPETASLLQASYSYPSDLRPENDKDNAIVITKHQVGFARNGDFHGIYKDISLASHIRNGLPTIIPEGALVILH